MVLQADFKSREIEILRLMAEGLTNREIAERLYIGVETVRWYAKQIYGKLNVSGREEAAARATSLGLLDVTTAQSVETPRTKPKHNLPIQLTSFIGREKQISEVMELLAETRLLTLTGPGGTGKTRLALKIAEGLPDDFSDGVSFVDLAPISDGDRVANAIANTLGIIENVDQPMIETLRSALGQREMLLLLDNYEHIIEAAAIVFELLSAVPNIKIMVTSREPLRVSGEQVYVVPPMSLTGNQQATPPESVALFVQRAQAVKQLFRLDETNTPMVMEICSHLDGMPLAIELAAAQSRFLTPDVILKRLENRFQSLRGGARDAPARQQTLSNTIDWSYNLLEAGEKTLFARLAVFRGGRSLEAIEAVCADDLPIDVFDGLAALVDKSMIRQLEDKLGEPRFVMLETIQEYALERLEEQGESIDMHRRHAAYFVEFAERAGPELRLAQQEYWFQRLEIEHDNIRTALHWALTGGDAEKGLRIIAAIPDFWFYQAYHIEGQRWIGYALEYLDNAPPELQANVLYAAAFPAGARQQPQQAKDFIAQALQILREQDNGRKEKIGWLLFHLGGNTYNASAKRLEDYEQAIALCEEGLAILRELDDKPGIAWCLNTFGNIHDEHGAYELAKQAYEDCLRVSRETGETRRVVMSIENLGRVIHRMGDSEGALGLLKEALALAHELNFNYMSISFLSSFAGPLTAIGKPERGAQLMAVSHTLMDNLGILPQTQTQSTVAEYLHTLHDHLDDVAFQAAWDAGVRMSLEDAVAYALEVLGDD